MKLAFETNFADGQKDKIINELRNKMQWKEPKTNMDGIFIIAHLYFVFL